MEKLKRFIQAALIPITLLTFWETFTRLNLLPSSLDAKPTDIFSTTLNLFFNEDYTEDNIEFNILISLYRLILGVTIGSILGLILAYSNSKNKTLRNFINPFLTVIGPIPIVIWIPIFMLVFKGNDFYKIGLISLATFLLVYLKMFSSFISIDKKYSELSRIYEKSYWVRFFGISLPHSLEEFFTSLRFSIAIGWIVLFIVEYSNADMHQGGLGYTIERFRQAGKTEEMFASVFLLAIISYLLDKVILSLMTHKLKWKINSNE